MKEQAVQYYRQGYNCSQCILKAAEQVYRIPIPKQCYNMCEGVNTGFGIGGMCSVLIAGIMILGLFFNGETVKRLRIKLLTGFNDLHRSINCAQLLKERRGGSGCEIIIGQVAELVGKIIDCEMKK